MSFLENIFEGQFWELFHFLRLQLSDVGTIFLFSQNIGVILSKYHEGLIQKEIFSANDLSL